MQEKPEDVVPASKACKQVFRHKEEAKRDSYEIQISKLVFYGTSYEWLEDSESQARACS